MSPSRASCRYPVSASGHCCADSSFSLSARARRNTSSRLGFAGSGGDAGSGSGIISTGVASGVTSGVPSAKSAGGSNVSSRSCGLGWAEKTRSPHPPRRPLRDRPEPVRDDRVSDYAAAARAAVSQEFLRSVWPTRDAPPFPGWRRVPFGLEIGHPGQRLGKLLRAARTPCPPAHPAAPHCLPRKSRRAACNGTAGLARPPPAFHTSMPPTRAPAASPRARVATAAAGPPPTTVCAPVHVALCASSLVIPSGFSFSVKCGQVLTGCGGGASGSRSDGKWKRT